MTRKKKSPKEQLLAYWVQSRRNFKNQLKAGEAWPDRENLKAYWDAKMGYRSREVWPGATFAAFVKTIGPAPKTAKPKSAVTRKSVKRRVLGFWESLFG